MMQIIGAKILALNACILSKISFRAPKPPTYLYF